MFEGVSRYIVSKTQLTFKTTHLDHFKTHEWRILRTLTHYYSQIAKHRERNIVENNLSEKE